MRKILRYLFLALSAAAFAACNDDSEFFYTTSYPVVRIDVTVTAKETTAADDEPENPLIQQIKEEVAAAAPVKAGGSYRLDFKYYDSGRLTVRTPAGSGEEAGSTASETSTGGFLKQPGAKTINFYFGDNAYAATISSYTENDGTQAVLLVVDLTEAYRALYPDADITSVQRLEYTSHRE